MKGILPVCIAAIVVLLHFTGSRPLPNHTRSDWGWSRDGVV